MIPHPPACPSQVLSTGQDMLADMHCHVCQVPLGWKYLSAQQVGAATAASNKLQPG